MLLKRQIYVSATAFVCAILFFTAVLSVSAKKRCGEEMPEPLLSLYLQSDLVVTANVRSEKVIPLPKSEENEGWVKIKWNLQILNTHKGLKLSNVSFLDDEYRGTEGEYEYQQYRTHQVGDKVLLFLKKNQENNTYFIYDKLGGVKNAKKNNLTLFETRLSELKRILASKTNKINKLTEWLVRLAEEPETRWDGAYELNGSYGYSADDEDDASETTKEPITIDENFFARFTPQIAKNLTDSQKERLSNAYFETVNQALSSTLEEDHYYNGTHSLATLVANWDKLRMVYYLQGYLQTASSNRKNVSFLMYLTNVLLQDDQLYVYSGYYSDFTSQNKGDEEETSTELLEAIQTEIRRIEEAANVPQATVAVAEPVKQDEVKTETQTKTENVVIEEVPVIEETKVIEKEAEKETTEAVAKNETPKEKITNKQLGERILQGYLERMQVLISKGFETSEEVAKTETEEKK